MHNISHLTITVNFLAFWVYKKIDFAASWCTCSVILGEDTCVASFSACLGAEYSQTEQTSSVHSTSSVCGVDVRHGGLCSGCFLIDLIMENRPWHNSQRV